MQAPQYIISQYGAGIAVEMKGDSQSCQQQATLANNIYGYNTSDLSDNIVYMPSLEAFQKFLIVQEYFRIWDEHWARNRVSGSRNKANIFRFTRRAIKRGKLILQSQVFYDNFMSKISSRNNEYNIGGYQDEAGEE